MDYNQLYFQFRLYCEVATIIILFIILVVTYFKNRK
jgi:hypothetical protein